MDRDKIRPGAPRALIVGATGLSGRYAARLFRSKGWHVTTLSRGTLGDTESDRHFAADLMDPAAVVTALAGLTLPTCSCVSGRCRPMKPRMFG